MLAIVTIKLPKLEIHNIQNKKMGYCRLHHSLCTDATGEHHSFLTAASVGLEKIKMFYEDQGYHVTRVEEVILSEIPTSPDQTRNYS